MNLMRQRDDLKRAVDAGALRREMAEKALSSPVFQWWSSKKNELTETESEFIDSYLMDRVHVPDEGPGRPETHVMWPKLVPYPCFRISYMDEPIYDQWWVGDNSICCLHCDDGFSHKEVKTWTTHYKTKDRIGYWNLQVYVGDKRILFPSEHQWGEHDSIHKFRIGKVTMLASQDHMVSYAGQVSNMLALFLFDIYGSGNCVVKVSPKPDPTKSVQWRQSREHYLVLRRQQVEKLRETKGHVIEDDIIRSAHWRRAHLRRLSSGKFVNKRGLLVPVKRAWVGPTEWQGHDGKIYTVVGFEPKSLT